MSLENDEDAYFMDIKYGYNHYNEITLSVSYDEIESFCLPSYLALEVGGSETALTSLA